jgi:hypothetical protein
LCLSRGVASSFFCISKKIEESKRRRLSGGLEML